MKRKQGSTIFLKVVIFLVGIAVLAVCIFGLPQKKTLKKHFYNG
ncbi:hypothetical protein BAOM_2761 [Peribacillus asahii]|uniref:Uncharacterized protein n=1 Tax=Peribacillus asahii TaxID=228899 RepID=A0A3T0KSU4_9BACI|nr:hypothetical protein [Peribacillus asahii]AZV43370.1 hypothetical protein BAOM_2761 [Peribacillus asahii]